MAAVPAAIATDEKVLVFQRRDSSDFLIIGRLEVSLFPSGFLKIYTTKDRWESPSSGQVSQKSLSIYPQ